MNSENEDDLIRRMLSSTRTIALVGASPNAARDSHRVMSYLLDLGYDVYPVNPTVTQAEILGRSVYPSLAEVPVAIDMVDVFRRSDAAGEVCDEAIDIGARFVWMQIGVVNEDGARRATKAGLEVVMDRCPRVEIPRLRIAVPGSGGGDR